ncbi:MAG: lipid A biosynthesis acyltransferase, partial [Phascolarctobacterium sp.]
KTKDKEQDFYQVTRQLVDILEQEITAHPEMWFWVHDRWKDGRQRFHKKK